MKKHLLVLPLIFSVVLVPPPDPFKSGESAYEMYLHHFDNFESSVDVGDYELACSELRLAFNILTFQFSQIREHKPNFSWVQTNMEVKDMIAGGCTPYGD